MLIESTAVYIIDINRHIRMSIIISLSRVRNQVPEYRHRVRTVSGHLAELYSPPGLSIPASGEQDIQNKFFVLISTCPGL